MNVGTMPFAQIIAFVHEPSFALIVRHSAGTAGVRSLTCAKKFRAMAFTQPT